MTTGLFRTLMLLAAATVFAGCRIEIMVSDGGDVLSHSGVRDCIGPSYCINEIDDADFSDTFTAVANPGYEFVRWQAGSGFICGDSTSTSCALELLGDPAAETIIATTKSAYLMPVFRYLGLDTDGDGIDDRKDDDDDNDLTPDAEDLCPRDPDPACGIGVPISNLDIVTVNGSQWAQPDLFAGATWAQINAVCPEGVCVAGGVLKGRDMTGWRWAHWSEIRTLFAHYNNDFLGSDWYLSGPEDSSWVLAFTADGWRSLDKFGSLAEYMVRGHVWGQGIAYGLYDYGFAEIRNAHGQSGMAIHGYDFPNDSSEFTGGWFYRAD